MARIFIELSDNTQVVCDMDLDTFYGKVFHAMESCIGFVEVVDTQDNRYLLNCKHIVHIREFKREDVV